MKKTYMKPTSEAMRLGLQGDVLDGIGISTSTYANTTTSVDGGNALVGAEKDWTDSSNFWGD